MLPVFSAVVLPVPHWLCCSFLWLEWVRLQQSVIRSTPNTGLFNCGHDYLCFENCYGTMLQSFCQRSHGEVSWVTFLFGQEGWEKLIYMSKVLKSEKNSLNVKEKTIFFWNTLVPWTFSKQDLLLNRNTGTRLLFSKSKINISHWVKCSGLGWHRRKFVNSAYMNVFLPTRSWFSCSAWTRAAQQGLVCLSPMWGLWWCLQSWCRYPCRYPLWDP